MAKLFICISERTRQTESGVEFAGFTIEVDCALDEGENPNISPILRARAAIEHALAFAIRHTFGAPIHEAPSEQTFAEASSAAAEKIENPFSQIEDIEIEPD